MKLTKKKLYFILRDHSVQFRGMVYELDHFNFLIDQNSSNALSFIELVDQN